MLVHSYFKTQWAQTQSWGREKPAFQASSQPHVAMWPWYFVWIQKFLRLCWTQQVLDRSPTPILCANSFMTVWFCYLFIIQFGIMKHWQKMFKETSRYYAAWEIQVSLLVTDCFSLKPNCWHNATVPVDDYLLFAVSSSLTKSLLSVFPSCE